MKRLFAAALACVALSVPALADHPVEGLWQTEVDDGAYAYVKIAHCEEALCGTITRTFNGDGEYRSPNIGRMLVIDMMPNGENKYRGQVWRPSNDKVYIGKMTHNGNGLKLRGCVAGGLLCSAQDWVRVQ